MGEPKPARQFWRRLLGLDAPKPTRVRVEFIADTNSKIIPVPTKLTEPAMFDSVTMQRMKDQPPFRARIVAVDGDSPGEILAIGLVHRMTPYEQGMLVQDWLLQNGYSPVAIIGEWVRL